MKQSKAEFLAIRYAENRAQLKGVYLEIKTLTAANNLDLSDYRKDWYGNEDGEIFNYFWSGWVSAVKEAEEYPDEALQLARLLDQKNDINQAAGNIKRAICSHGRALIRRAADE